MRFCILVCKQPVSNPETLKAVLGKILYLTDTIPEAMVRHTQGKYPKHTLVWIHTSFQNAMIKMNKQLTDLFVKHQKTPLQSTDVALTQFIPLAVSKILWTSQGTLNIGIIGVVKKLFLERNTSFLNYDVNLSHNLEVLKKSTKLQQTLEAVCKPSPDSQAHQLLCASLGLPFQSTLTDLQAKQTVLAALLSPSTQDEEISCFAQSLGNQLLLSRQEKCVEDFASLVQSDHMIRFINGNAVHFPFLLRIEDADLQRPFHVTKEGNLTEEGKEMGNVTDSPGIQAVCRVLGITDPIAATKNVLTTLFASSPEEAQRLSIQKFISLLIKHNLKSDQPQDLQTQAELTFTAQTHNLLLKTWINAMAGMAEGDAHGYLKSSLSDSVHYALQLSLNSLSLPPLVVKKTLEQIDLVLENRIHYYYDPTVRTENTSWDEQEATGGFILYEKLEGRDPTKWKRISSHDEFQAYIQRVVENAMRNPDPVTTISTTDVNRILDSLSLYVQSKKFLYAVMVHYKTQFPIGESLSKGYRELLYTPWVNRLGHDANQVLQVYMESATPPQMEIFTPGSAQELLEKFINKGRKLSADSLKSFEQNACQLIPLRVPNLHAFSLITPDLYKAWKSNEKIPEWILKNVVASGQKIAHGLLDSQTRIKTIQQICEKVVDSKKVSTFNEATKKIPKKYTVRDFRKHLLDIAIKTRKESGMTREQIGLEIDAAIIDSLPSAQKKQLQDSLVRFADTNWHSGTHKTLFCFGFNPGAGQLEIMEVLDDFSQLKPIRQSDLIKQPWEHPIKYEG